MRSALIAAPEGDPLLWVAPKQSTFQLEREVLAGGHVRGFTRLQVLPFDRLAAWVLSELGEEVRDVLPEEGRVMVLHALLLEAGDGLAAFGRSARTLGFAAQLSHVLRELQRVDAGPEALRKLPLDGGGSGALPDKIQELAALLEGYREWLERHGLRDADELLVLAASALTRARKLGRPTPRCAGLWLDGFAEMTVPELDLLAALLPGCAEATLAFCLASPPGRGARGGSNASDGEGDVPPTSLWGVTAATYLRCEERVRTLGLVHRVRVLPEAGVVPARFRSPGLADLARGWIAPAAEGASPMPGERQGVQLVECADPEAEALLAVRLVHRHVREGGRYREVSVVVRRMEGYGDVIQRAFRRHGIPYFADQREPMAHHPVAELTRSALRMAAGAWAHEDWIGALKSGLVVGTPRLVDHLENAGLAAGLSGDEWMRPAEYERRAGLSAGALRDLARPLEAFAGFREAMRTPQDGPSLSRALRTLWADLRVPETLEDWQAGADDLPPLYRAIHHTAWEQILAWADAVALAFEGTAMAMDQWLAVAEAGLSRLTLGVIPPALDQVLVGAIDRARQPEVRLTLVLGLNEGVFPAPPGTPALLNRVEREHLAGLGLDLGWTPVLEAAREHYYAYIACTRPSDRLCLSWSRRGLDGRQQVRSSVAERVLALLGIRPGAEAGAGEVLAFDGRLKAFDGEPHASEASSLSELFECPGWDAFPMGLPSEEGEGDGLELVRQTAARMARLRAAFTPPGGERARRLHPDGVARLHPSGVLTSSVSALEDFAACPFRHFAQRQLRLKPREEFEADAIGAGNMLHAVLEAFHRETLGSRGAWRRWDSAAAADCILQLGEQALTESRFAPLVQDPLIAWQTRRRLRGLSLAVREAIEWMSTYSLDPVLAEFRFGDTPEATAPAWVLPLGGDRLLRLRGSIDRLDVGCLPDGRRIVAVFDYKSTASPSHAAAFQQGLELQLLGYLAFAVGSTEVRRAIAAGSPGGGEEGHPWLPCGAFEVPLAPKMVSLAHDEAPEVARNRYLDSLTHLGHADRAHLAALDGSATGERGGPWSRQFKKGHFRDSPEFQARIDLVLGFLRQHAEAVLDGVVGIQPVRYGANSAACDHCDYAALCRFEPLRGEYRTLVGSGTPAGLETATNPSTDPSPEHAA